MGSMGRCGWEGLDVLDFGGFWDSVSGCSVTAGAARTGDRGLRVNASFNFVAKQFKAAGTTDDYFGRICVDPQTSLDVLTPIVRTSDSGTGQSVFEIRANADDTLELWKGGGTPAQIGSDSPAMSGYASITWEYDQSTATVTAYLDGTSFASGTVDAAHDNVDTILIGFFGAIGAGDYHFDDFAHNDQTGSIENGLPDWRGKVYVAMPDTDHADDSTGSRGGSDSGSDFGQVDERPTNDGTDYYALDTGETLEVECSTGGAALPAGATVKVVHVGARHRSQSAAAMSYQLGIRSVDEGTLQSGSTVGHNDTAWRTNADDPPRNYSLASYTDPEGSGPWTADLLSGAHLVVTAIDGSPAVWVSTLWMYVEYVEGGFQPAWARAHNQLLYTGSPDVH